MAKGLEAARNGAGLKEDGPSGAAHERTVEYRLSAEEFVSRLRLTYVHFCALVSPSVAWLSRTSGVPYETLRFFLSDETHLLCWVNEEKLARALGHTSEHYRKLVRVWSLDDPWEIHLRAAVAVWLVQAMAWLQGRELVLMEW